MNRDAIITGLSPSQGDGLACVVCGADFLRVPLTHAPVGRSVTGLQVFACAGCAEQPSSPHAAGVSCDDAGVVAVVVRLRAEEAERL
jgi:hypothetical protein